MPEDLINETKKLPKKSLFTWGNIIPLVIGVSVAAAIGIPLYLKIVYDRDKFMEKEIVGLEGVVISERYVPPSSGGCSPSNPSQYFFSLDDPAEGRVGIEVMGSYEPRVKIESIEAKLETGTKVKVQAREVAPGEYKAFASEVHVESSGKNIPVGPGSRFY